MVAVFFFMRAVSLRIQPSHRRRTSRAGEGAGNQRDIAESGAHENAAHLGR